jgi:AcrR family transcriptional regulator
LTPAGLCSIIVMNFHADAGPTMTPTDKKDDILQAALILFAERGYYGTPVSLIAEKAHVGSGTIYRYFKDKDELVNVLYRTWKQAFMDYVAAGLGPDQTVRSVFHVCWERMTAFALNNKEAFIFLEAHHHAPYMDRDSRALSDEVEDRFAAIIEAGQAQQVIAAGPPNLLAPLVFGPFAEMIKRHWAGKLDLTPALVSQAEEMTWQAIRR